MKNKIRVLNIQETIGSGGVERRRLSLAKLLDKEKFELKIICTKTAGSIADEIRSHNVEVIPIGLLQSPLDWKQHKKVMKIIDEYKPHIIHGAVFEGVTMAAVSGFIKRVPIIIIEETSDPQNRSWKGNLLMKLFAKVSKKVIGVSPASTQYLIQKLGLSEDKVVLINNGVIVPRINNEEDVSAFKTEYGISDDAIVIGSIGRMLSDETKRFSDLIKAFSIVKRKGLNVKLFLVGEGPEKEKYELLVKEYQLENDVFFPGYQSNVGIFYDVFDVFSLVSAHESFGLVLAEAMLHKLPVVATRVGGMQYIVDDGKTGYLVEKYNVEEIAEKLAFLCSNKKERDIFGENGFQKAMKEYTEERYVQNVQQLYESLFRELKTQ